MSKTPEDVLATEQMRTQKAKEKERRKSIQAANVEKQKKLAEEKKQKKPADDDDNAAEEPEEPALDGMEMASNINATYNGVR